MRIALISTPRSGNTWVRASLATSLGLRELAVHNYLDLPAELPEKCVIQIHWYREPNFQAYLRDAGLRPVVVARHPLDVLVSILHFVRHEPDTIRWLCGNGEILPALKEATPVSREFLDWAMGWGAENLLSISYQWWHEPAAIRVRYEDLISDPQDAFLRLLSHFTAADAARAAAGQLSGRATFQTLSGLPNRHGWQGRSDVWRDLIVPLDALRLYRRHRAVFRTLGYRVRPRPLGRAAARRAWEAMKR